VGKNLEDYRRGGEEAGGLVSGTCPMASSKKNPFLRSGNGKYPPPKRTAKKTKRKRSLSEKLLLVITRMEKKDQKMMSLRGSSG